MADFRNTSKIKNTNFGIIIDHYEWHKKNRAIPNFLQISFISIIREVNMTDFRNYFETTNHKLY